LLYTPHAPDWLIARPIAHRGLHDARQGRIENSLAAAEAASAAHYAIECDVQITKDGDALVFHDFQLDRLTQAKGKVADLNIEALRPLAYRNGDGTLPSLAEFLQKIAGRTPLIIEIKSLFDGDLRLAQRVAALLANYDGPVAVKCFDPAVLVKLRALKLTCPIGFLGEAHYDHEEWAILSPDIKQGLIDFAFFDGVRPDFISWYASDLPHAAPRLCRSGLGLPVMTWTIRSPEARARVSAHADQIVFEGFAA